MSYQHILFSLEGGVARLTLNRPERLNSLTAAMHGEIRAALAQAAAARVLLITGAGRAFCAGQDLNDRAVAPGGAAPDLADSIERYYKPLVLALRALPLPVIAAVNGVAFGGGCELSLACDVRIAARSARFGQPEIKLGIMPGWGGTQRLPRLIGRSRATELLLTGDPINAETAFQLGLVSVVVEDDALAEAASSWAHVLGSRAPLALAAIKRAINEGAHLPIADGLALEQREFATLFGSEDAAEGVSAFMQKRQPTWKGR